MSSLSLVLSGCLGASAFDFGGHSEPVTVEKPTTLPTWESIGLYASTSPLNTAIGADPQIDPDSDQYVALLVEAADTGGFQIELGQYSAPVFFADDSTPTTDVQLACGDEWAGGINRLQSVPIPRFAEPANDVDGALNPIPKGACGADADQDNQMVVVDRVNRCEYDFFQARQEEGRWVASWANGLSLESDGIYREGFSARGSGFSTLAGLIWPDELEHGQIHHALGFSYPYARSGGPVPPATESDGASDHRWALPEGARLQLDPTLDLDSLPLTDAERTIARALQKYGMFLLDFGGGVSIEAVDPKSTQGNPYAGLLPETSYPSLNHIPIDRMRVIKLPLQDSAADDKSELVENGCARFE